MLELSTALVRSYRINISAAGVVQCLEANFIRVSGTIPGLDVSARKILVHWSTRPDGSDTRSELAIYNYVTGVWLHAHTTHAALAADASHSITVGGTFSGTQLFSGGLSAIYQVRIGARYHSGVEAQEDWVAETSAPTIAAATRCEGTPITNDTEIATHAAFAGPAALATGRSTRRADRRLLSPIVNEVPTSPLVWQSTYAPAAWHRLAWGATTSRLSLAHLFRRPVPANVRQVYVRVHVLQWEELGGGIVPVYLRCYSADRLPTIYNGVQSLLSFSTTEVASNTDDGVGADGRWLALGVLTVARDIHGMSYFALAYDFNHDVAHADLAATRLRIQAITIDPYPSDAAEAPNGLDVQEGG